MKVNELPPASSGIRRNWKGEPMDEQSNSSQKEDEWEQLAKKIKAATNSSTIPASTTSTSSLANSPGQTRQIIQQDSPQVDNSLTGTSSSTEARGMDIDQISKNYEQAVKSQWIKFMRQAGNSLDAVSEMFTEEGEINSQIEGWMMEISTSKEGWDKRKRSEEIKKLAEDKPLLVCGEWTNEPISSALVKRCMNKQSRQGRYFWIHCGNKVWTNMMNSGKFPGGDNPCAKLEVLMRKMVKDGRFSGR